jgi:ATP-binding protein involved in chromosome partitioning
LLDRIAANGDSGVPFILEHPDSSQAAIYMDLARSVVSEVAKAKFSGQNNRPAIVYDKENHVIQVTSNSKAGGNDSDGSSSSSSSFMMKPADLRRACRCASCVEELTGRQILVPSSIPDRIAPMRMAPTGNYALSVDWSDGHRSLYPYRQILSLVQESKASSSSKSIEQEQTARFNQVPV